MTVHVREPLRLSQPGIPAVHTYYDFAPESPDGSRVLYSQFEQGLPGPATLMLANRDGSDPTPIATTSGQCIGHTGGFGLWLDAQTIAYQSQDVYFGQRPDIHLLDLKTGGQETLTGKLRAYTPVSRCGIMLENASPQHGEKGADQLHLWHRDTGQTRLLFDMQAPYDAHPAMREHSPMELTCVINPKWHADGRTFMFVYTNVLRHKPAPKRFKSIMIGDADTGSCRYLCEFADHPLWSASGDSLVIHDREQDQRTLVNVDPETGRKQTLINPFVGVHSSLNRAGTHLITDHINAEQEPRSSEVLLYELATGQRQTLVHGGHGLSDHVTGTHVHPVFSHDESRIYFNSGRDGVPGVYAIDIEGLA